MFEVAVVGLGLVGSAALRYLATAGTSVVGIGPAEPEDWSTHGGPFASHYDSGRITRRLDARYEWAVLASRSIAQYPALEAASGLRFHHPAGLLFVRHDAEGIGHQRDVIDRLGLPVTAGSTNDLPGGFAEFAFPSDWTALYEPAPAGYIDPRAMLRAQLAVAQRRGAELHRTPVRAVHRAGGGFRIECAGADAVEARRVLLAAGAYTSYLLSEPLAASVAPETVILARVSPAVADRLAEMPSLIYLLDHPEIDDIYVVPPIRYPDGETYVKMGGSRAGVQRLESPDQMREWMAGHGAEKDLPVMRSILESLLPDVAFEDFAMKPCLITDTVHGLPFVDELDNGLFVAAGGNGHAAKSADAIGAMAAGLVSAGIWIDPDLDRNAFRAMGGAFNPGEGSRHGN